MLKEEYSKKNELLKALYGYNFATYIANNDREKYIKYINGENLKLSNIDSMAMNILSILDKLGYPMNELGTYLYKEVIAEISHSLNSITDIEQYQNLVKEITNVFSPFYYNIAKEYLEMNVNIFHLYLKKALENIDYNTSDIELISKLFGPDFQNQNFGLNALKIATYALELNEKNKLSLLSLNKSR